ncbi:MAG: helix-turn-helix transcriptional regulator [Nitriliruptoraceae bacterium]
MPRDEWVVFDPASLGSALAHFRKQAGLTQEALARRSGLHRPYLSHLEQGRATSQTERLFRVLRRLDLELVLRRRGSG